MGGYSKKQAGNLECVDMHYNLYANVLWIVIRRVNQYFLSNLIDRQTEYGRMHASKRFQRMLHLGQEIRDNNRKWRKKGDQLTNLKINGKQSVTQDFPLNNESRIRH